MDVERYMRGWREQARCQAAARERAEARARVAIPEVAVILRRHGARRIWLIGSLPRGTFRPGSDLDFLTEGLSEEAGALATAEASGSLGLAVDVLRIEALDQEWRSYHVRYGELLHV